MSEDDSKPATSMGLVPTLFMWLMPLTQACFWAGSALAIASDTTILLPIAATSVIMWLWAIRQKLGPTPKELGVFTWPLHIIAYAIHRYASQVGGNAMGIFNAIIMWGNYGVPALLMFKIFKTPSEVIASKAQKTILWADIVKFNFASALAFFSFSIVVNVYEIAKGGDKR